MPVSPVTYVALIADVTLPTTLAPGKLFNVEPLPMKYGAVIFPVVVITTLLFAAR